MISWWRAILSRIHGTFSGVAACLPMTQPAITIDGVAEPDRLVMQATDNFFAVLGVRAAIGRVEAPRVGDSTSAPNDGVAVVSERLMRIPKVRGRLFTWQIR